MHSRLRTLSIASGVVMLTLQFGIAVADPLTEFYSAPVPDLAARTGGDVVRRSYVGPPLGEGLGLDIERILYRSTDTHGEPMAVSGYTMTPQAPWPGPGPRPVIAYAPGTSGMADRCAGSAVLGTVGSSPAVLPLLLAGYEVVATDYQGLGTPGGHTYLNRLAAGHALLDAARAAVGDTDTPVVLFGYSEGGHASAAAAELASVYAPELNIAGSYVGAPPADPTLNTAVLDRTTLGTAMLFAIAGQINAYPEYADAIRAGFNDRGKALIDQAQNMCINDPAGQQYIDSTQITIDGRPLADTLTQEPAATIAAENTIGLIRPSVPILLASASSDDTIPIEQSRTLLRRWQDAGATDITYREYTFPTIPVAGANHAPGGLAAYPDVMPWIAGVLR